MKLTYAFFQHEVSSSSALQFKDAHVRCWRRCYGITFRRHFKCKLKFNCILKSFWPLVVINVIVIIWIVEYWKSMCFVRSQGSKLEEVEVGNAKFEQVAVESGKFTHRLPSCEGHSEWTRLDPSLENRRNRSLLDVTNSIARGPTGGRTSKEDSALTWNRVHPLTLQFGWFESRDKDRECLWEYKKESCLQEPLNEGHSAYVLCVTECSKRKGHQSHPHCFRKRRKVDPGESWTLTLFHHEYILMCERESFFFFFFFC